MEKLAANSMTELDRRKSEERRRARRFAVTIDVDWESHFGRRTGTMSDISEEGCFILSEVDVSDGELCELKQASRITSVAVIASLVGLAVVGLALVVF